RLWSAAAPRAPGRVNPMPTRRHFVESLVSAGAAVPALTNDGLDRLRGLARRVTGRAPADVARDEDFWLQVQQAFTLDRTLINLNNGGVSPSPRVVQEAMRRYLDYSNTAPAYTMWQILEPEIEAVRRRLAASFGCDPEEMAITRNASEALETVQLGIPLARGDEVIADGAHAYAHFPFTRDDLDCDYYGTSLHKWLLAPHGTGFLYVRKAKIATIWPLMAAPPEMNGNIRKFEEIGTHPAANHNAI